MPLLQKYQDFNAHYVMTNLDGKVGTYQLTPAGARRLADAGIVIGQRFERGLLLDLIKTGDAYGLGHEFAEAVRANQLALDLEGDPNPQQAFPVCDGCRSVLDLHLELTGKPDARAAYLRCPVCRATPKAVADTSIPLTLLSRSLVTRLFEDYEVLTRSENVLRYITLLDTEFVQRWDAVRKQRSATQAQLFSGDEFGGLGFG